MVISSYYHKYFNIIHHQQVSYLSIGLLCINLHWNVRNLKHRFLTFALTIYVMLFLTELSRPHYLRLSLGQSYLWHRTLFVSFACEEVNALDRFGDADTGPIEVVRSASWHAATAGDSTTQWGRCLGKNSSRLMWYQSFIHVTARLGNNLNYNYFPYKCNLI